MKQNFSRLVPLVSLGAITIFLTGNRCAFAAAPAAVPPVAPAPVNTPSESAPLPVKPTAPAISVLIIALDEIGAVIGADTAMIAPAPAEEGVAPGVPATPAAPAPAAPIVPATPPKAPAAIMPARDFAPATVRGVAKKAPVNEDDLFRAEPERREAVPVKPPAKPGQTETPAVPMVPNGITGEAGAPVFSPAFERAPSPALSAAALLRRTLAGSGFTEVLSTAVNGVTIMRAITARRLTERVVNRLQTSMQQIIAAPATPPAAAPAAAGVPDAAAQPAAPAKITDAMQPAILAASRIGQTLGYRAVIVLAVLPRKAPDAMPAPDAAAVSQPSADYALLITDTARRTADIRMFDSTGVDDLAMHQVAAETGAAVIDRALRTWPEVSPHERAQQVQSSLAAARAALAQGDVATAQDDLNEVVALDPRRTEAYLLLGDALQAQDPAGAAVAYRRATAIDATDGAAWAKLAVSFTLGDKPDWPLALQAARSALAVKHETAALRIAMAVAEYGRAKIFRQYNKTDQAEDAELAARGHLDRALELEPDSPQAARLMTNHLIAQNRYRDAVKALDRLVQVYPDDIELQTQYALALAGVGGRDEEAFVAWSRIWKLNAKRQVPLKADQYRRVVEGFDLRVASIGKQTAQLTGSVASGALPRETALLQLSRYKEDMAVADATIKIIQPPAERMMSVIHAARTLAADLMSQALEAHQIYLETGQDIYRTRAAELHRNCINQLNAARTARG